MALYYKSNINGSDIAIWKIEEDTDELIKLSHIDSSFYDSYNNPKRKREVAAVRALLFDMLGEYHEVLYTSLGKPYLKYNNLNISISHTVGYVAIILNPNTEVGIDIEKKGDTVLRVKHKYMSDRELDIIASESDIFRDNLIVCWSAKETLFKIINKEEIDFIEHLVIDDFIRNQNEGKVLMSEHKTDSKKKYTISYKIEEDFVISFCVDTIK